MQDVDLVHTSGKIGTDLGRFWDLGKLSVFREGVMFVMKSLDLSGRGLFAACETFRS